MVFFIDLFVFFEIFSISKSFAILWTPVLSSEAYTLIFDIKSKIISDAQNEATEKANKLIEAAKTAIDNEKSAAMKELKNTVVDLSLNIAEKLLSKELDKYDDENDDLVYLMNYQ